MRLRSNTGLSYDDVLLVPQFSSVSDLDQVDTSTTVCGIDLEAPIISSPMDTVTEVEMVKAIREAGGLGILHRFNTIEEQVSMAEECSCEFGAAVGVSDEDVDRAEKLVEAGADFICVDVAHAHLEAAINITKILDDKLDVPLMVGTIATLEAAEELSEAGADALRVGVGAGSHCITRKVAGAGVPQLTAIEETSRVSATIIADGGIETSGDIVKALMAGADAVILGGLLMGTTESSAVKSDDEIFYLTRGMASNEARKEAGKDTRTAEGVEGVVEHKGSVNDVVTNLVGGIQSGLSYCGGHSIGEARENHEFIRVTPATQRINGSHGIGLRS